jgi:molecular chaperone GrpE
MKKRDEDEQRVESGAEAGDQPPAGGDQGDGDQLAAERDRLQEQLQRTLADLQNIRRQTRKQIEDSRAVTTAQVMNDFLPVLDNLERAAAAGGDPDDLLEGLQLVLALFRGLLERNGVQRIPGVGEPFDPKWHEALQVEPRTDVPAGTIIEEIEAGYRMGDRLLRGAKVKVSQAPQTAAAGDAGDVGEEA